MDKVDSVSGHYTHGHAEAVLRSHRWRTVENSAAYLAPHLGADDALLDVGAGPGTITVDLAGRVARVTATEISEDALALSRAAAAEAGVANIDFAVEDVHGLTFADGTFDVVHAHQVLQHVADPVAALREMARVTKPGGLVAVRDADYGMFTWWPGMRDDADGFDGMARWLELYSMAARTNGGEPDAGRRLLSWAYAAGLDGALATSSTWTYASPDERQWWGGLWADRLTSTALGEQLVSSGLATRDEVEQMAGAWREWASEPDGWFCVPHGEILWRKPNGWCLLQAPTPRHR